MLQTPDEILRKIIDRSITEISDNTITSISGYRFAGCKLLENVTFGEVLTVGNYAFQNCILLTDVTATAFPKVTSFGNYCFDNCTGLTSFHTASATKVNTFMFQACKALRTFVGRNVGALENNAFYQCSGLTSIDVTSSGSWGTDVFRCTQETPKLNLIIIRGNSIKSIGANTFRDTRFKSGGAGGTIYINKYLYDHLGDGTSLDYKAATIWSTIDGYGTITWAQIEGSTYETHYVDGTLIPT